MLPSIMNQNSAELNQHEKDQIVTNEELFRRYFLGDEAGLRSLIDRHGDKLTYYINGYVHDLQEAEDLMIEAFSRVVAKQPNFEENGFNKTARNLALRQCMQSKMFSLIDIDEVEAASTQDSSVLDDLINNEKYRIISRSLDQIHTEYREAIYLHYFEQMSYSEAAEVMKKTVKQVSNLIYRGKQALKPILAKEGLTDEDH
jgi:RNA polymerase sigma-70 factor (ECF subfamily)